MTKKETVIMLGYTKIAYPNLLKDDDPELLLSVWYEMLCDEESALVKLAMKKHIAKNKYPPSISELLELIEHEKWSLYTEYSMNSFLDDEPPKQLPCYYIPRSISRQPKQYEKIAATQISNIIEAEMKYLEPNNQKQLSSQGDEV